MNRILWTCVLLAGMGMLAQVSFAGSIEQQLIVVLNTATLNGDFQIAVQVKGTGLTGANTLGSATIDVQFDNTKLSYQGATGWAFGSGQGYARSATNNTTYIRVGVLGTTVNGDGGGSPAGYDIGDSYATWVQLNYKILDASSSISLSIAPGSNAIGLFGNHSNEPLTGVINDQTLSPPINISNEPLPIQLASFSAAVVQQSGNVVLKWSTASEVNNYGFTVQRKGQHDPDFVDLSNAFLAGKGTTIQPQSYRYVDQSVPNAGAYSYRLKQQDLDGKIHFAGSVNIQVTMTDVAEVAPKVFALHQNYPNPFNPSTQIKFSVETTGRTVAKVFNMLGEEVATLFDGTAEAGRYYVATFNASGLASGIYFCRLTTDQKMNLRKMLLVK